VTASRESMRTPWVSASDALHTLEDVCGAHKWAFLGAAIAKKGKAVHAGQIIFHPISLTKASR
jgi:hypothetical protein